MSVARISAIIEKWIDKLTNTPVIITGDHHYIHKGLGFSYAGETTNLAASGSYSISFKTPPVTDNKYLHFRPTFFSSSANYAKMELREGSTVTGGSSGLTSVFNRSRSNKTLSKLQNFTIGVTVSVAGTLLDYGATGATGGVNQRAGGQSTGSEEELILKPDTTYSITFTNAGSSTATDIIFRTFWYEE